MQFAKDSFFLALQTRLAGLNPARTVTINGATVPAVLVVENLPPASAEPQPNTFYIEWGSAAVVNGHAGNAALMSLECAISYYSLGTVQSMVDRGRVLGELDGELLGICQPTNTEKYDYTQSPSRGPRHDRVLESAYVPGSDDERSRGQHARVSRARGEAGDV